MDDSDDYIVDDIVFDDQTLAALDKEEKKHLQQPPPVTAPEHPVNKRHKTNTGWKPGIGANLHRADSYEDLPEISLRGDGSYGIESPAQIAKASVPFPQAQGSKFQQSHNQPSTRKPNVPPTYGSRALNRSKPSSSSIRVNQLVQIPQVRGQESNGRNNAQQLPADLESQMSELQRKVEEMRNENARIQTALKQAIDGKLAKEGETAQNHAAQLAQLKAERERAESKQVQMQKDLKDEMERLKTQFLFKQQELEASIRKPPATVRSKKINREPSSTPLVGLDASQISASRRIADETPVRPRLSAVQRTSPIKNTRRSPEKSRKYTMLPGFENSFETSTPLRPSLRRDKGKGKEDSDLVFGGSVFQAPHGPSQPLFLPSQSQRKYEASQSFEQDAPSVGISTAYENPQPGSEQMDISPPESVQGTRTEEVEVDDFEPLNRKTELCRILLLHTYSATSGTSLQIIMSSAHLVNNSSTDNYSTYCSRILEVIADYSTHDNDYDKSIQITCNALLAILATLRESRQMHLMIVLLDLLTKLVLYLSCHSFLLAARPELRPGQTISTIDLLCSCILEHVDFTGPTLTSREFADELFNLLEVLCFRIPQDCIEELVILARHKRVFMKLLHNAQPDWLLERSTSLLALLSRHHRLSAALLDCSVIKDLNPNREHDQRKNPFIERLCWHLIDLGRSPIESSKLYVLILFSQLSIAHPDTYAELVDTYALIPSLILYTSQLSTPIWEDDESLCMSSEVASSYVQALAQTTFLLHQLIFDTDPCLNVRLKLHQAPHRPFNGIDHMFVVTFGRLSYGEPPTWLQPQDKQTLQFIVDIAREILELVIDGPETDSVWAAFQPEQDEESVIDEGEMEAQLMGVEI